MAQLTWSPEAVNDLTKIAEFVAQNSGDPQYVLGNLLKASERITLFPRSGRLIPEYNDSNRREVLWKSYRIMYQLKGEDVLVTAVIHGARDFRLEIPE